MDYVYCWALLLLLSPRGRFANFAPCTKKAQILHLIEQLLEGSDSVDMYHSRYATGRLKFKLDINSHYHSITCSWSMIRRLHNILFADLHAGLIMYIIKMLTIYRWHMYSFWGPNTRTCLMSTTLIVLEIRGDNLLSLGG